MWIGEILAAAILADDPEALRSMLGHHELEMADAIAHLGDIFSVAFEKGRNVEAILVPHPLTGPVAVKHGLEKAVASPCFSKLRVASSTGFERPPIQATPAGATANSNCASQPSCAHTGFLRVKGLWNFFRLHFLQANWLRKALNSSQRAFSSPIEPPP